MDFRIVHQVVGGGASGLRRISAEMQGRTAVVVVSNSVPLSMERVFIVKSGPRHDAVEAITQLGEKHGVTGVQVNTTPGRGDTVGLLLDRADLRWMSPGFAGIEGIGADAQAELFAAARAVIASIPAP